MIQNNIQAEKRKYPRLEQNLPITLSLNGNMKEKAICRNISEGGAFIELPNDKFSENISPLCYKWSKIQIKISLVGNVDNVEAVAITRWSSPLFNGEKHGFGMEFVEISDSDKNRIASYIAETLPKKKVVTERVPHDAKLNYTKDFVQNRREWLSNKTGVKFSHISYFSSESEEFRGNIENFVGVTQIPIGIVGPLLVKGDYANGVFYVPFATTEGAMVETYQRGAIALAKSGGVKVFINKDANRLDPIFLFSSSSEARNFLHWIKNNYSIIKDEAESTTGFGKLTNITPYIIGRRVILDIAYYTSDAMGANMINMATEKICQLITKEVKAERYLLRSNLSSEKKASAVNLLIGYGKEVIVEAKVPEKIVRRFLFSTPKDIATSWHSWALSSFSAGMFGMNAHFANGVAAIFIACGQDVAHVSNASVGILSFEQIESGDLYISLKLPNIILGTVGGGTALATQRECLEMIGCYGQGKAKKFAEIVGATLLAGELGICAGITSEHFLDPHKRARKHTREKAYKEHQQK